MLVFQLPSVMILPSYFLLKKISLPQGYTYSVLTFFFPKICFWGHAELIFDYGMKQFQCYAY